MNIALFYRFAATLFLCWGLTACHPAPSLKSVSSEAGTSVKANRQVASSVAHQAELGQHLQRDGLRIPFLPNYGQLDNRVRYYARISGGTVFVTGEGELVYSLYRPVDSGEENDNHGREEGGQFVFVEKLGDGLGNMPVPTLPATTNVTLFHGSDPEKWQHDLPGYPEISLGEIYQGIEVRLAAHGNSIEKLFYCDAGADPENIKITIPNGSRITVTDDGQLDVATDTGNIRFSRPVAWQDVGGSRRNVDVVYAVTGNTADEYSFSLGSYDVRYPLMIDPLLQSTYLGGSSNDEATDIAIGPDGFVYVVGRTYSSDFPRCTYGPCVPTDDNTFSGSSEAFVARISADLSTLSQTTYLGGSDSESAEALAIDGAGNVYVTGYTDSADFPGTAGGADTTPSGRDGFVAKLNWDLRTLTQSTYVGGSSSENPRAIVITNGGDIIIGGTTTSNDLPNCSPAASCFLPLDRPDNVYAGDSEGFLAIIESDLSTIYTTYLGGSGSEDIYGLAVPATGNTLYVCGMTTSTDLPFVSGTADTTMEDHEAFVTRLSDTLADSNSTTEQSSYFGGSGYDECYAIAMNSNNQVLITGETSSADLPYCTGMICLSRADSQIDADGDAYAAILSADLSSIGNSTYLGGTGFEMGTDIVEAPEPGNAYGRIVYVTGETYAEDFQNTHNGADPSFFGNSEGFVVRLDSILSKVEQATYLGGNSSDYPAALAVSSAGDIYVTGQTRSPDFPRSGQGFDISLGGTEDAFISRFSDLKGNGAYYVIPMKSGKNVILHLD